MADETSKVHTEVVNAVLPRRVQWGLVALTALVLILLALVTARYYLKTFERLADRSAMDVAQVARNISEGQGFSTRFIRPFNVALQNGKSGRMAELNAAPVYPYLLSILFNLRTPSDQVACWASMGFFLLALLATLVLGLVLFDRRVGLIASAAVGLSAPMLNIATSGREISLAMLVLTLLFVCIALHHRAFTADQNRAAFGYSVLAAVLTALLYATNYVLALAALPVAVYFWVVRKTDKHNFAAFTLVVVLLMSPFAYRNMAATGFPVLGVRAWDLMTDSIAFPGDTLLRSTDAAQRSPLRALLFPVEEFGAFAEKLARTAAGTANSLVAMLGLAVLPFAVVSVLYRFKGATANAVRGVIYGLAPVMMVVFGLYGESPGYACVFAPAAAVFACAYLCLLLDSKKLHPFFVRAFVGSVLLVTSIQAIPGLVWGLPSVGGADEKSRDANLYYASLGTRGVRYVFYTDVPWLAAWRTTGLGVWLPRSDGDVYTLEAKGLHMRVVILTPVCETYSNDETWRMLHEVRLWRAYIENPQKAESEIIRLANIKSRDFPAASKSLKRLRRQYAVSSTISGFVAQPRDPLAPDDIQVLLHPDLVSR